jgi:hypothetical protein
MNSDGPDTKRLRDVVRQELAGVNPEPDEGLIVRLWDKDWFKTVAFIWCAMLFLFTLAVTGSPYTPRLIANAEAEQLQSNTKAIHEIQTSVAKISTSLDAIAKYARAQQIKDVVSEICRSSMRRAKETDIAERQRLLDIITSARNTYYELTAKDFQASDC